MSRILFVTDDEALRIAAVAALVKVRHETFTAGTSAALENFDRIQPDVVIYDANGSDPEGMPLAHALQQRNQMLKLMALRVIKSAGDCGVSFAALNPALSEHGGAVVAATTEFLGDCPTGELP